ncbi:MAG TPA: sugar-binding protein, partial [Rhodothermales bacterium]|nr:sugar-binding protein [Rhodothermales bacterium]
MRTPLRPSFLRGLLYAAIVLVPVGRVRAQTSVTPTIPTTSSAAVQAVRVTGGIDVDGRLDEATWAAAPAIEGFRQNRPSEGAPASQRTVVRVLYDDNAIYVGARMYDTAPDSIISRLGRRDDNNLNSDDFVVFLDPYHDKRSGFYFAVNVAGTLYDGTMFNDSNMDDSWDGVWLGKTARDAEGWTAEFRIPYSQLRFAKAEVQTWGVNFQRNLARRNEESRLRYVPSSENGFVSHFADLTGIERIRPPRGFEAVPYVTSRAAFTDGGAGNPFNDGSRYKVDAGADVKLGLSSNLTLSATVNPDFGQVEVDPAVVN